MLIPRLGSEVTSEWLQMILEEYERKSNPDCSLSVLSFDIKKGTQPGENFNSDIDVTDVKCQLQQGEQVEEKSFYLLLKFLSTNITQREANRFSNSHVREFTLYSELVHKLNYLQEIECQGKHPLNVPELYYSYNKKDDFVLVMKNLKLDNYLTNDPKKGLDKHQLELAFVQIARFHALSYVYDKRFNLLKEFPMFAINRTLYRMSSYIIECSITNLMPLIEEKEEFKELSAQLLKKDVIRKRLMEKIYGTTDTSSIKCLLHGDFWNNNLMYQYNHCARGENSIPSGVKLLDWQMCYWNDPIIDLQYLMHSSTTYDVRKTYSDHLLHIYHSTFDEITTSLGCHCPEFTYEAFTKKYNDAAIVGFCFGIIFAQGTLSEFGKQFSKPASSTVSVRDFSFSIKSKMARILLYISSSPSFLFLTKKIINQLFSPFGIEIREGKNEILNTRLLELLQEANINGTFSLNGAQ